MKLSQYLSYLQGCFPLQDICDAVASWGEKRTQNTLFLLTKSTSPSQLELLMKDLRTLVLSLPRIPHPLRIGTSHGVIHGSQHICFKSPNSIVTVA